MSKLEHFWRTLATGIGFCVFGLSCLLLRFVIFPTINFCYKPEHRQGKARKFIKSSFKYYINFLRLIGVFNYQLKNLERLNRKGLLIIANHPSLIDIIFLMMITENANCVVKGSLANNIFTLGPIKTAAYIKNNDTVEIIYDCISAIKKGENLIIFPEGTRTPENGELNFKRGAANIAIRGQLDITPIFIKCLPRMLGKGKKWWQMPRFKTEYIIDVKEDIKIADFINNGKNDTIAVRDLNHFLKNYFEQGKKEYENN